MLHMFSEEYGNSVISSCGVVLFRILKAFFTPNVVDFEIHQLKGAYRINDNITNHYDIPNS